MVIVHYLFIFASWILVSSVELTLAEQNPGELVVEVVPPYFEEGQEVRLMCSIPAGRGAVPLLSWTPPNPNQGVRFKLSNHMGSDERGSIFYVVATIPDVKKEDEGEYVCKIRDSQEQQSYRLHLTSEFGIKLNLRGHKTPEITVFPGAPVELIVDVYARPSVVNMTWRNNENIELKNNSNGISFFNKKLESRLTIENATLKSAGVYTLVTYNGHATRSLPITVKVAGVPEVQFPKDHDLGHFLLDQQFNITCDIRAGSVDRIKWYLTECEDWPDCGSSTPRELPADQFSNSTGPDPLSTQSTLRITSNQTAVLNCEACNIAGCGNANYTFLATDLATSQGDLMIEGPEEVVFGENVTVKCAASKYFYSDEMTWTDPENEEISDRGRVWKSETKYSHVSWLNFTRVKEADNGEYLCDLNQKEIPIPVSLTYTLTALKRVKVSIEKPVTDRYEVKRGDLVMLDCVVQGVPKPEVTWYLGEDKLSELKKSNWQLLENNTLKFYFELDYGGVYTCKAKNKFDETFIKYKVSLPAEQKPSITDPVKDSYKVTPGELIMLDCPVHGFPRPDVTWYWGTEKVSDAWELKWELMENNTLKLLVNWGAGGLYKCEANNTKGLAHIQYNVTVPGQQARDVGLKKTCYSRGHYNRHKPADNLDRHRNTSRNAYHDYHNDAFTGTNSRTEKRNRRVRSASERQVGSNLKLAVKKNRFFAEARRELKKLQFPAWFLKRVKQGLSVMISSMLSEYKLEYDCFELSNRLHKTSFDTRNPSL